MIARERRADAGRRVPIEAGADLSEIEEDAMTSQQRKHSMATAMVWVR